MKLTEEQKEIALRLMAEMREEENDEFQSDEDFVCEIFARFLAALPKPEPEPVAEVVKYGCHVDGDHDVIPNCVHDTGDLDDCTYAQFHEKKQDCPHWKPIKFATPPQPDDVRDAWQPIETAPKDGTEVLICRAVNADGKPMGDDFFGLFVHRAAWWGEEGWIVYNSLVCENACFFEPTHWMPIPKAPAIAAAKGEVR